MNIIKEIRLSLGMTLEEFGGLFIPKASDSIVSRWEKNISIPNPDRIKQLSKVSNKTTSEIYNNLNYEVIKNKQIGERIKIIRKEKGMTLEEFANLFEPVANKSNVSRWEKGLAYPSNERIKKIAEIGNISVEYLLNGDGNISIPKEEYEYLKQIESEFKKRGFSNE